MYGGLATIANDEGMVLMNIDHVSPLAHIEEKACAALDDVSTPSSDEDRFRCALVSLQICIASACSQHVTSSPGLQSYFCLMAAKAMLHEDEVPSAAGEGAQ